MKQRKGIYFRPETEDRRDQFYGDCSRVLPLTSLEEEAIALSVHERRASMAGYSSARHPEPGRDGQAQNLNYRARVNLDPKSPDEWAAFDTGHPIEKMRIRGSLGQPWHIAFNRYRAARVWYSMWVRALGLSTMGEFMAEQVDGGGDKESGVLARMDAANQRVEVLKQRGMTPLRMSILDSVCGAGTRISEIAHATGRDRKAIRKCLLGGLDAVYAFPRWNKQIEAVQVIWTEPITRRAG